MRSCGKERAVIDACSNSRFKCGAAEFFSEFSSQHPQIQPPGSIHISCLNRNPICQLWAAAGSVDTDLSFLSFLELYRTHVAQRRMAPGRVVEPLDVIEDVSTGLLPGSVYLPSRSLCLQ